MLTSDSPQVASKSAASWYMHAFAQWNRGIVRFSTRYGGSKAKEVERFLKFATVGVLGAIIDFGVLNLLQATVLHPEEPDAPFKVALATGIAFVSAVSSNFIWNRYWTYPDSRTRSLRRQWAQFFVVSVAGLIFRLVWVRVLFDPFGDIGLDALHALGLGENMSAAAVRRLGTNIAQFWAVWIVMIWNFYMNRHWTYNDVE